jgi:hypothetical protein
MKQDPNLICIGQRPEDVAKAFAEKIAPLIVQRLLEEHSDDYHLELRMSIVRDAENKWADYAKWNIYEREEKKLFGVDV